MKSEEIAKLAGISRSTVSRVINNYSNVPEKTREKVMKIIEEYGYEPNSSARVLAGKGINTIGLFVISVTDKENPNRIYQNNYFAPFVDMVIDTANTLGYYVLAHTVYTEEDYVKVRQAFMQKRVDGGIVVGTMENAPVLADLAQKGHPIVFIDYDPKIAHELRNDKSRFAIVNSMDFDGATKAVEHLIEQGHKNIAFMAGKEDTFSGRQRLLAYKETLKKHNIEVPEEFILHGDFIKKKAYIEAAKISKMNPRPTALFSANDDMALACLEALEESGLKVNEDISLVGFDDIAISQWVNPALTTVKVPVHQMAKEATEALVKLISDTEEKYYEISLPAPLIVRDSSKKIV